MIAILTIIAVAVVTAFTIVLVALAVFLQAVAFHAVEAVLVLPLHLRVQLPRLLVLAAGAAAHFSAGLSGSVAFAIF